MTTTCLLLNLKHCLFYNINRLFFFEILLWYSIHFVDTNLVVFSVIWKDIDQAANW